MDRIDVVRLERVLSKDAIDSAYEGIEVPVHARH